MTLEALNTANPIADGIHQIWNPATKAALDQLVHTGEHNLGLMAIITAGALSVLIPTIYYFTRTGEKSPMKSPIFEQPRKIA